MNAEEVKCGICYDSISKKSYLWFVGNPPLTAIDLLRKEGWVYNGEKDKWRCKYSGEGSYTHAQKMRNRFCGSFGMKPIGGNAVSGKTRRITQIKMIGEDYYV